MKTLDEAAKDLLAALDEAIEAASAFDRLYTESTDGMADKYEIVRSLQELYAEISGLAPEHE